MSEPKKLSDEAVAALEVLADASTEWEMRARFAEDELAAARQRLQEVTTATWDAAIKVVFDGAEKMRAFMETKPIGDERRRTISRRASEWYAAVNALVAAKEASLLAQPSDTSGPCQRCHREQAAHGMDGVCSMFVPQPSSAPAGAYQEEPGRDYRKERDLAYTERNRVVAALARLIVAGGGKAWLAEHPEDPTWDPEWKTIVFIEGPTGQLSWHLHDTDVPLFAGLPRGLNSWDGHSTPEKYERVARLAAPSSAPAGDAKRAEALTAVGEHAVSYYLDVGECLFCDDLEEDGAHDDNCPVGGFLYFHGDEGIPHGLYERGPAAPSPEGSGDVRVLVETALERIIASERLAPKYRINVGAIAQEALDTLRASLASPAASTGEATTTKGDE